MPSYTIREGLDAASVPDSDLASNAPDVNYGAQTMMRVGFTIFSSIRHRSILRFDLSVIPDDESITSAKLTLYCGTQAASAEAAKLRRLLEIEGDPMPAQPYWLESEVTWNERESKVSWDTGGGDYTTDLEVNWSLPTSTGDMDITGLKPLVDDARDNRVDWLDLILMRASEASPTAWVQFNSGEHATAASRPRLVVETSIAAAHLVAVDGCCVRDDGHFATVG